MIPKIILLKEWIKDDILPYQEKFEHYILVTELDREKKVEGSVEQLKLKFYTDNYIYIITAIDREWDNGYLGCICKSRKSLAGEEEICRGRDLPDGVFIYKTWFDILKSIIKNELKKIKT